MQHTLRAVDEELRGLAGDVATMGDLAVAQVASAVDVFLRHDLTAAAELVRGDEALDAQDAEIERRAVRFNALRAPVADDLRRSIAAMKIASQLERCGDLAKNIAKRVAAMDGAAPPGPAAAIANLGRLAADRLSATIQAYRDGDAQAAHAVWLSDTELDRRHDAVLRQILATMAEGPSSPGDSSHLLFIAKNLERIGDHATNIAELLHYQLTGAALVDRPKG
jgi:phosphate transport system protein